MSPLTTKKHADEMRKPALCELLPVREYLDGVMVQVDGSLVTVVPSGRRVLSVLPCTTILVAFVPSEALTAKGDDAKPVAHTERELRE